MSNMARAGKKPAGLGFIIEDIRKEASHLTQDQYMAALHIIRYMEGLAGVGSSDGLVGQMQDKVDCSTKARTFPPIGSGYMDERTARQIRQLRQHEIALLTRIAHGRGGALEEYGKINSSYKVNRTARAFAIGRVTALLESVAELAQLKPEVPPVPG